MSRNEANTRKELIDKALEKAGWNLNDSNQVGIEIPVDGYDAAPWNGVTDYCLYLPNGEVIAVVEAKRQSRDPRVAEQQVRHYVTQIEKHQSFRPFAFMSNGDMTFFWDVGNENKRPVAGFFSLRDLQNLLYIRQNKIPLQQLSVNLAIANRTYQQEAIGRVSERFDEGHRRALLVMATGTGKTRTIMALIEVFLRANQARTVLFVADRDALVRQALDDNFKVYLPNEPRDRIRTYNVDYSKRLYVGTLQTLIKCYKKFTPGFFDLVIFDESHRSIYNQFREVVEYFDARIIGLTATPADFIERNTFQVFRCTDGIPTFNYPLILTAPKLRSQVDQIWDRLWSSGLSNPMDSIEQFSYLLFLKRLDDAENQREKQAKRRNKPFEPQIKPELRWSHWINFKVDEALKHVREEVFPWLRTAGTQGSSFERYMQNAEFKISKPGTLIEVCNLIDALKISEQNQDVQGDLYEYLLSKLNTAGRNGQFRTPRHIIRMMVQMVDPKPKERIGDLAAGTCGFLVNAYEYILEQYSEPDEQGKPQLIGDLLSDEEREFLQTEAFTAYDKDAGMTMLRIGSMNLMLHGIKHPRFFYMDTLSKSFNDEKSLEVVLMNPPLPIIECHNIFISLYKRNSLE